MNFSIALGPVRTAGRIAGLNIRMNLRRMVTTFVALGVCISTAAAEIRSDELAAAAEAIDQDHPGSLGVYAKHLASGETVRHRAERRWYLASTVKLPLAIAILQAARDGEISLQDEMVLEDSHRVDGAGHLLWADSGARHTVESLIGYSIENSDSTATD